MMDTEFAPIDYKYQSTAERHFVNAEALIKGAKEAREFFYAALEVRFCIERLCLEYLVLLTHSKRQLTKAELKLYVPKEIFRQIYRERPNYDKLVDFFNLVMPILGREERMKTPDSNWLQEQHGRLGNYLHLQREPLKEQELISFTEYVRSLLPPLKEYILGRGHISALPPHLKEILADYENGRWSRDQVQRMIEIANIPEHMLNPSSQRKADV